MVKNMNTFMNALKEETNYNYTWNGALVHASTLNKVFDMFARAGAMRLASIDDCIYLFKEAYEENAELALKCLFWNRDVRDGNGERRFFRVCLNWLAKNDPDAVIRNLDYIPLCGRYDDLYCLVETSAETAMWQYMKDTIAKDMEIVASDKTGKKAISLLAKWMKSINTSSKESCRLGMLTQKALGMTARQYRKTLSTLRKRINVLETLMSANQWDAIDFSGIPSKAGFMYRNAFRKHQEERYVEFITNKRTKVNANALYPYEAVAAAAKLNDSERYWWLDDDKVDIDEIERAVVNKYWDNLYDYFEGKTLDALCVVDTSASMRGSQASAPINVAISLGLYCAERAQGPFHNHYISFSSRPQLIETTGIDFVDKVDRIYRTNLCQNTNIEATFDLLLNTAILYNIKPENMMKKIIIISDMQFDYMTCGSIKEKGTTVLMDEIQNRWEAAGYKFPNIIYWNVNAENPTFPQLGEGISYVSGFSPAIFECILSDKDGIDLMLDTLGKEKYKNIK